MADTDGHGHRARPVSRTATETSPAQLQEQLGLPNVMMVPRLEKIVLNMGVGDALAQPKLLEGAVADLSLIAGQKPVITRAKKSIAGFKLRDGQRHRRPGDAAGRPHVGVLRPADQPRHPPRP